MKALNIAENQVKKLDKPLILAYKVDTQGNVKFWLFVNGKGNTRGWHVLLFKTFNKLFITFKGNVNIASTGPSGIIVESPKPEILGNEPSCKKLSV